MVILKNGRIIDPANKINSKGDLYIKNGKIEKVSIGSKGGKEEGYRIMDVKGAVIAPGLVDMHVHLREPGFEYKEDILSGSMAAAAGGFTSVACMANTKPVNDNGSVTGFIVDRAKSAGIANVFPIGSVTKGQLGKELSEFGDLKDAGAVALSDDGNPIMDTRVLRRALEYAQDFDLPIIEHCEDTSLRGKGVINEGFISTRLGLEGIPCECESTMVARDAEILKLTGGSLHIAHVSCEKSLVPIRKAKEAGLNLTCEVTPHHFTLTEEASINFDTNTKVNPPLRTAKDIDAIKKALREGIIDAIASDHAPHAFFEKNVEFDFAPFGIIGLETTLSLALALVEQKVIDISSMIGLLSLNPSKILNLKKGTLSLGADADVVVFDPEAERKIDACGFRSKSANTPFGGFNLKGKVLYTIKDGNVVFDHSKGK